MAGTGSRVSLMLRTQTSRSLGMLRSWNLQVGPQLSGASCARVSGREWTVASDKIPLVVTLAVAIVGWSATYVVGRITSAPTLEYEVSDPSPVQIVGQPGAQRMRVRLANLTRAATFKNLTVVLLAPKETTLLGDAIEILPLPPAFEGNEPWKLRGGMARYTIPKVQPGWEFVVQVAFTGKVPPVLRFESDDSVYTTVPTWETRFVRYEVWILAALAAVWASVIAMFVLVSFGVSLRRKRPTCNPEMFDETG